MLFIFSFKDDWNSYSVIKINVFCFAWLIDQVIVAALSEVCSHRVEGEISETFSCYKIIVNERFWVFFKP